MREGITRRYFLDEGEKKITFVVSEDVEPVLDQNRRDRSEDQHMDWGRRIARIPPTVQLQWFNEEHAKGNTDLRMYSEEWDRLVMKKLNDPDWAYLRTDKKPTIITGIMGFGS